MFLSQCILVPSLLQVNKKMFNLFRKNQHSSISTRLISNALVSIEDAFEDRHWLSWIFWLASWITSPTLIKTVCKVWQSSPSLISSLSGKTSWWLVIYTFSDCCQYLLITASSEKFSRPVLSCILWHSLVKYFTFINFNEIFYLYYEPR